MGKLAYIPSIVGGASRVNTPLIVSGIGPVASDSCESGMQARTVGGLTQGFKDQLSSCQQVWKIA